MARAIAAAMMKTDRVWPLGRDAPPAQKSPAPYQSSGRDRPVASFATCATTPEAAEAPTMTRKSRIRDSLRLRDSNEPDPNSGKCWSDAPAEPVDEARGLEQIRLIRSDQPLLNQRVHCEHQEGDHRHTTREERRQSCGPERRGAGLSRSFRHTERSQDRLPVGPRECDQSETSDPPEDDIPLDGLPAEKGFVVDCQFRVKGSLVQPQDRRGPHDRQTDQRQEYADRGTIPSFVCPVVSLCAHTYSNRLRPRVELPPDESLLSLGRQPFSIVSRPFSIGWFRRHSIFDHFRSHGRVIESCSITT